MALRVQGSWQSVRSLGKASPAARPKANNLERRPHHTACVAPQQKETAMTQVKGQDACSQRGHNAKGGITVQQLGRFVLIMGMMLGMSVVGCTGAASEKPSVQPGRFSGSQAECTKLSKSVDNLERDLARAASDAPYRPRVEAELATARQDLAKCEGKGQ